MHTRKTPLRVRTHAHSAGTRQRRASEAFDCCFLFFFSMRAECKTHSSKHRVVCLEAMESSCAQIEVVSAVGLQTAAL